MYKLYNRIGKRTHKFFRYQVSRCQVIFYLVQIKSLINTANFQNFITNSFMWVYNICIYINM